MGYRNVSWIFSCRSKILLWQVSSRLNFSWHLWGFLKFILHFFFIPLLLLFADLKAANISILLPPPIFSTTTTSTTLWGLRVMTGPKWPGSLSCLSFHFLAWCLNDWTKKFQTKHPHHTWTLAKSTRLRSLSIWLIWEVFCKTARAAWARWLRDVYLRRVWAKALTAAICEKGRKRPNTLILLLRLAQVSKFYK